MRLEGILSFWWDHGTLHMTGSKNDLHSEPYLAWLYLGTVISEAGWLSARKYYLTFDWLTGQYQTYIRRTRPIIHWGLLFTFMYYFTVPNSQWPTKRKPGGRKMPLFGYLVWNQDQTSRHSPPEVADLAMTAVLIGVCWPINQRPARPSK